MQHAGPWKAIIMEVHIFYFEPLKQVDLTQLLRYMKPLKGQTVRELQGPPVCGREGELVVSTRRLVGAVTPPRSQDVDQQVRSGLGIVIRVRHSPLIAPQ